MSTELRNFPFVVVRRARTAQLEKPKSSAKKPRRRPTKVQEERPQVSHRREAHQGRHGFFSATLEGPLAHARLRQEVSR